MDSVHPCDKKAHGHPQPFCDITNHELALDAADCKGRWHNEEEFTRRRRLGVLDDVLLWRRYSSWALPALLTFCLVLLYCPLTFLTGAAPDPPRKTNGYTDVVTWDNYTLWIHDQRVFLKYVAVTNRTLCLRLC